MVSVKLDLQDFELWKEFHRHTNEMILTRAGRCLFPVLKYIFEPCTLEKCGSETCRVINIDKEKYYKIVANMNLVDDMKWKWKSSKWTPILASAPKAASKSPQAKQITLFEGVTGGILLSKGIMMEKIKLTNRRIEDAESAFTLKSFHRYIPTISIIEVSSNHLQIIQIPETEFIAVTHYQNENITNLKKSFNPHAKGFLFKDAREKSSWRFQGLRSDRKRVHPLQEDTSTITSTSSSLPSDEEELKGGIALQLLASDSKSK